mmetsp:Transcript_824/g.1299  ORF Transcript_824/g.1299 Transcript_824/m.1299 type:complete len:216 (-) Transcript_824:1833-2480(-)
MSCEAETFSYRQVSLHKGQRSASYWFFVVHDSSAGVQHLVNASNHFAWALNFNQKHRLVQCRLGSKVSGVVSASSSWDDLPTSSVDCISVQISIDNIKTNSAHIFARKNTFFSCPLESRFHGVFDFVHVLNSFGGVYKHTRTLGFRSKAPEFLGVVGVPTVLVLESAGSSFRFSSGGDVSVFDFFRKSLSQGLCSHVKSVVFVGGFGHANLAGSS